MVALEIAHVCLLVPELKQLGSAVILESGEVGIDLDIGLHECQQHFAGSGDALGINKDCSDQRLKHVAENLQVVLVKLVQVKSLIAVFCATSWILIK